MSLFGPTVREMTDAVDRGIHQAIHTSKSTTYRVKQGKLPLRGKYVVIPPEIEVSLYPFGQGPITEAPKPIFVPNVGNDIVFDVIKIVTEKRFNPFTDVTTSNVIEKSNVARYYSYDGWNLTKINKLIMFAFKEQYYPSDDKLADMILKGEYGQR